MPRSRLVSVRLTEDEAAYIWYLAEKEGRTASSWLRRLIISAIKEAISATSTDRPAAAPTG